MRLVISRSALRAASVAVVLVACAAASAGAYGEVFGSPVVSRGGSDGAYQITFIDTANPAPFPGLITSWSLYAVSTGDMTLQIWRPTVGGYKLICANPVSITSTGVVTLPVAPASQIFAEQGDLLGFRYAESALGTRQISFNFGGGGVIYTNWPLASTDVAVGATLPSSAIATEAVGQARTYSLAATIVPEPAALLAPGLAGAALARRRR